MMQDKFCRIYDYCLLPLRPLKGFTQSGFLFVLFLSFGLFNVFIGYNIEKHQEEI